MNIPVNIPDGRCDTCGTSWNELTIDIDDDGQWEATLTVGCYGRARYEGDRAGLIEWLREDCAFAVAPDVLRRAIDRLEAL